MTPKRPDQGQQIGVQRRMGRPGHVHYAPLEDIREVEGGKGVCEDMRGHVQIVDFVALSWLRKEGKVED